MSLIWGSVRGLLLMAFLVNTAHAVTLTNPIVFVTQPPIPRELNGTVSNTFLSVVTIFGNQQADTAHAARGGDLWLMTTNTSLVNLTRAAGFGTNGIQHGIGIGVRDPHIHWLGKKVLFSMVVGSPTNATDTRVFYWQLYELANLDAVIGNNATPVIVKVSNQPTNCNNVTPCYATDDRIIFMSDKPYNGFAALDEYKGHPTVTGTYSLDTMTGDLKMIEHTPSGAFSPFVDSFGRLILTRWDHLSQDPLAADDRLGITNNGVVSMNGSFNYLLETSNSPTQSTNIAETFPEPRSFDTNATAQLGVNGISFNFFFPWALDQDGGNEEILNHVGRQELLPAASKSFIGDTNLVTFTNLASRTASGVISANVNSLAAFFQIVEDPRTNGLYWGVQANDISPFGGSHAAGQILTLTGGAGVNPANMIVNNITITNATGQIVSPQGVYRNPLPMSDGKLVAVFSPVNPSFNLGVDTNTGTASLPVSQYQFRLMTLTNTTPFWKTNVFLTGGIQNTSVFWSGTILVTNIAPLWELQPVEVRAKNIPVPVNTGVAAIEKQVFTEEGVDLTTFQADLAQRDLALCISRNVTARDAADKQQPYNLNVPGGSNSIANSGRVYDITHLQFLQADYLRGYTTGPGGVPMPGRRILAVPMHATTNVNYASSKNNAPPGGTELMSDGSQATFIPANRAVTWQLTGTTNESVVKERYWLSFKPGEVRTCANCHGINVVDQLGRTSPTNAPLALRQLLRFWRTNSVNAYSLTVSNGTGGGNFGAGSILTLTANPASSGKVFAGWNGAGVGNPAATTTLFIMPTSNVVVSAVFTNLPAPVIGNFQFYLGTTNLTLSVQAAANQPWILQCSTNLATWQNVTTNVSNGGGLVQFTNHFGAGTQQQFFRIRSP